MSTQNKKPVKIPDYIKFIFGGSAGMGATLIVQPLDLVKNRMQLSGEGGGKKLYRNSLHAVTSIIKNEGVAGIYAGLSAGLLRQATYTTTRMGVFETLLEKFSKDGKQPGFLVKTGLGMTAGGLAAYVGTPAEVALIRMTSDGRLPAAERRGYTNVFNALIRITREEGLLTLWKGATPTVIRAMVVNGAQLSSYAQAKESLLKTGYFRDGILLHFSASMISGLITTIASMPVDIVKTRIQSMKLPAGSKPPSAFGIFGSIVKNEGVFSLWKGFTPYYARLGPHTVFTFIFLEQMNAAYKNYNS